MIRRLRGLTLFALALTLATPAQAKGVKGLLVGLNGILTAAADPVANVVTPPERFDEVPVHEVTGRLLGIVSGTLLAAERAGAGALDVAFTPFWVVPTLSPDVRFAVIPGAADKNKKKK